MDYTSLQKKYGGKHIARRGDEVLESANTMGELLQVLKDKGLLSEDVTVEFVRPKDRIYALRVPASGD